jgi:TfoX/Sxy family transcriptional regulator of competence genes
VAYDEGLAERIRLAMAGVDGASERKMFGGICFMVNGNMACGVIRDELMARVGDAYADLVHAPHARPMDFVGRPMKGMLYVAAAGVAEQAALKVWVERCVAHAAALPSKYAAPSTVKRPAKKKPRRRGPRSPRPRWR